mgnify:CR=1 FL=1
MTNFSITSEPIVSAELIIRLEDPDCGAVATFLGILFALSYGLAALFIFTWLTVSLIFKYSSLSSIFSSLTVFIIALITEKVTFAINPNTYEKGDLKLLLFIILILIIFTHRKNISKLKNGTEQKIKL